MSVRIESFEAPSVGARWGCPRICDKAIDVHLAFEMGRDGASYSRKVLITGEKAGGLFYSAATDWDACFIIRDTLDATLALTYLAHMKGACCVLDGSTGLSDAIIVKVLSMSKSHGITVLLYCQKSAALKYDVDGLFFPAVYPDTKESQEVVELLRGKMGGAKVAEFDIDTILKEMRASRALLQWSKWGEPNHIGSLYWNYEGVQKKMDVETMRRAILGVCGAASIS